MTLNILFQGTDITEAFETHHISNGPKNLLNKYKVREAKLPRTYLFTYDNNGLYMKIKDRIRNELPKIDRSVVKTTNLYSDILFSIIIFGSILSAYFSSYWLAIIPGVCLGFITTAGHNYTHKRDNWRMYYLNLSFLSHKYVIFFNESFIL